VADLDIRAGGGDREGVNFLGGPRNFWTIKSFELVDFMQIYAIMALI